MFARLTRKTVEEPRSGPLSSLKDEEKVYLREVEHIRRPDNEAVENFEALEGERNTGDDVNGDQNTRIAAYNDTAVPKIDSMTTAGYVNYMKKVSTVRKACDAYCRAGRVVE